MGTGQIEVLPEEMDQERSCIHVATDASPVDRHRDTAKLSSSTRRNDGTYHCRRPGDGGTIWDHLSASAGGSPSNLPDPWR